MKKKDRMKNIWVNFSGLEILGYNWVGILCTALTILFILIALSLREDEFKDMSNFLAIWLIAFIAALSFSSNLDIENPFTLINVGLYLFLGVIYMLFKVYREGKKYKPYSYSTIDKTEKELNEELKSAVFSLIKDSAVSWIVLYPISILRFIGYDAISYLSGATIALFGKLATKLFILGHGRK